MKHLAIILFGVLLWFFNAEKPLIFPDANVVQIKKAYVLSPLGQLQPIMVVKVCENGKIIYTTNLLNIKAIMVGEKIL